MKKIILIIVWVVFFYLGVTYATKHAHASETFPTDTLTIRTKGGKVKFTIEVATTEAQKEQGLMFREKMPLNHGMIFELDAPQHVEMWMKNTILPLDMVFIDSHGIVEQVVKNAKPESLDIISSEGDNVLAVLEINGGAADHYHIVKGSKVVYSLFK